MDEYKHYIRIDSNNIVIHGFSDAFEQFQQGDIQLSGDFGRHFQIQLRTDRGQYLYKLVNNAMTQRTQEELDTEWAARPEPEKSPDQKRIELLEAQLSSQNEANTAFIEFVLSTLGVE